MFHSKSGKPLPLGLGPWVPPKRPLLKLAQFRAKATVAAYPAAVDLLDGQPIDSDPLGNNDEGDCGVAGPGHQIKWLDAWAGREARVNADRILSTYHTITGGPDVGVDAMQLLDYWRANGICGAKAKAYLALNTEDILERVEGTFWFGGVHYLLALPVSAQGQTVWDEVSNDGGLWGNHWVWSPGISPSGDVVVKSWGLDIGVTQAFIVKRCFAAFVVLLEDALGPGGRAFPGLDMAALEAALAAL